MNRDVPAAEHSRQARTAPAREVDDLAAGSVPHTVEFDRSLDEIVETMATDQ